MIAVLGRGKSLSMYPEYAHLFKKVYLVNPFTREIDALGPEHFKGKELVHVISKGKDCRLTKEQYELFPTTTVTGNMSRANVPWRYLNFKPLPDYMKDRGFPLVGWDDVALVLRNMTQEYAEVIGQLEAGFSDVIAGNLKRAETAFRCWPTTGIFAIDLALMTDKPWQIFLFGFDCFQNGTDAYFIETKKSHQSPDALLVMKFYLRKLVREFATLTTFRSADDLPEMREEANWRTLRSQ